MLISDYSRLAIIRNKLVEELEEHQTIVEGLRIVVVIRGLEVVRQDDRHERIVDLSSILVVTTDSERLSAIEQDEKIFTRDQVGLELVTVKDHNILVNARERSKRAIKKASSGVWIQVHYKADQSGLAAVTRAKKEGNGLFRITKAKQAREMI